MTSNSSLKQKKIPLVVVSFSGLFLHKLYFVVDNGE